MRFFFVFLGGFFGAEAVGEGVGGVGAGSGTVFCFLGPRGEGRKLACKSDGYGGFMVVDILHRPLFPHSQQEIPALLIILEFGIEEGTEFHEGLLLAISDIVHPSQDLIARFLVFDSLRP